MLIDWFTVLASEKLRQDAPFFQERLDYVYEPLLDLADREGVEILGFGAARPLLPEEITTVPPDEPGPVPAVVFSWPLPVVGRAAFENGDFKFSSPFDDMWTPPERGTIQGRRLDQDFSAYELMLRWLDDRGLTRGFRSRLEFAGQVVVLTLPCPLAQIAPGEAAHCSGPAGPGTFGARIRSNGVDGFLTAGHAAPNAVPAAVYDSHSSLVGKITQRMCCDFDSAGLPVAPNSDVPDVAVIELSVPDPVASTANQGVATIRDTVTADGAVTSGQQSELSTVAMAFAGPGSANWGEAMLTAYAISAPGDSGAQVLNASGEVVGQVVGGYPGVYSVVQDIDYLLKATGAVLR